MKRDLYQEVTDRIIKTLENGVAPWVRPWKVGQYSLPHNGATGRRYSGINVCLLWQTHYTDNRWYTFEQARSKNGCVRKGEKGTGIIFFNPLIKKDDNGNEQVIPFIRGFTVFNHEQIKWEIEESIEDFVAEITFIEAKNVVNATDVKIQHGGGKAFYRPGLDIINMPEIVSFRSEADYWGTMFHELIHWTGHESRNNRQFGKRFGDNAYAMEELVAEMGAAFLCAQSGVEGKLQHAEYISSWLKLLHEDKKAVFTAAKQAQQAVDFILAFSEDKKTEKAA